MTEPTLEPLSAGRNESLQHDATPNCSSRPTAKELHLSIVAFVTALLFVGIGFASEAAGAHWYVGCLCGVGVFLCVFMILRLHGLELKHFLAR